MYAGGAGKLGRAANWFGIKPFGLARFFVRTLALGGAVLGGSYGGCNGFLTAIEPPSAHVRSVDCFEKQIGADDIELICRAEVEPLDPRVTFRGGLRIEPAPGSGMKFAGGRMSDGGKLIAVDFDVTDANPGSWDFTVDGGKVDQRIVLSAATE